MLFIKSYGSGKASLWHLRIMALFMIPDGLELVAIEDNRGEGKMFPLLIY